MDFRFYFSFNILQKMAIRIQALTFFTSLKNQEEEKQKSREEGQSTLNNETLNKDAPEDTFKVQ